MNLVKIFTRILGIGMFCFNFSAAAQTPQVITLERALEIGLAQSFEIKQAKIQLEQYRHTLNAWKSAYGSYADFEAYAPVLSNRFREVSDPQTGKIMIVRENSVSYRSSLIISQPILFTDGTLSLYNSLYNLRQGEDETYQADITLSFKQPLFKTSTRKIDLKRAELNLESAQVYFDQRTRELKYNITEQFLNLFSTRKSLELARESEERSREVYQLGRAKYQAGLFSEMDLLKVEVEVANDQNTLLNQEEAYENALEAFKLYIGLPAADPIEIQHTLRLDSIEISEAELLEAAIKNHPERRLNEIDIKISELEVRLARARRQFTIDMNLEYGFSQLKDNFKGLFHQPEMTQVANIGFNVPLWDSGEKTEYVLAAQEALIGSELTLKQSVAALKVEVREIIISLNKNRRALKLAESTEEKARRSYQYSVMQFNAGSITSDELALARERLNTASLNNLRARIDYLLTVEKVRKHLAE